MPPNLAVIDGGAPARAWLDRAGPYRIEKIPCPHPNDDVDLGAPPAGILHTTEGGWASALQVFREHYAPHFLVGLGRIAQLIPLGKMAAAVEHPSGFPETNRVCRAQIEVVGYSKTTLYQFDTRTLDALAELLATLKGAAGIPLLHPFPDAMPPLPWATRNFSRRHSGKWGRVAGWYGHVEIPGNSHWDPGQYRWTELLRIARTKVPAPPPPPPPPEPEKKASYTVRDAGTVDQGHTDYPGVLVARLFKKIGPGGSIIIEKL
jgi:hypothetical protein